MNPTTLRWLVIAVVTDVVILSAYLVVAVWYHLRRWLRGNEK